MTFFINSVFFLYNIYTSQHSVLHFDFFNKNKRERLRYFDLKCDYYIVQWNVFITTAMQSHWSFTCFLSNRWATIFKWSNDLLHVSFKIVEQQFSSELISWSSLSRVNTCHWRQSFISKLSHCGAHEYVFNIWYADSLDSVHWCVGEKETYGEARVRGMRCPWVGHGCCVDRLFASGPCMWYECTCEESHTL